MSRNVTYQELNEWGRLLVNYYKTDRTLAQDYVQACSILSEFPENLISFLRTFLNTKDENLDITINGLGFRQIRGLLGCDALTAAGILSVASQDPMMASFIVETSMKKD